MGGGKTQTIEKDASPWTGQQPYIADMLRQAQQLQQTGGPDVYTGTRVAAQSPLLTQGQQYVQNYANTTGVQQVNATNDALYSALQAPDLNSGTFQNAAEAAIRPAIKLYGENVLPQIRGDAQAAGQFGGSRQGIAEGIATDRLQQNILDTTSKMALDYYNQGLTAQGRAIALAPQTMQAGMFPGAALSQVGGQQMQYEQMLLDAAQQQFAEQEMQPWNNLGLYQNLVQGNYGSKTNEPVSRTSPLMSAMGGGAMGAAIGASTGVQYGGWYGAAVGALLGLFGAMG